MRRFRAAPAGQVTVTCSWDAPIDGGVTNSYLLEIVAPDGTVVSTNMLPAGFTSFPQFMTDSTETHTARLTSFNTAAQPCETPATITFVPHVETPPPPGLPGNPTGLAVAVES